jgi:hypothetical protein
LKIEGAAQDSNIQEGESFRIHTTLDCSASHWLNISSFSVKKLVKDLNFFSPIFSAKKTGENVKVFSHFSPHFCLSPENVKMLYIFHLFFTEKIGEKKFKSFTKFSTEKLEMFNQ